MIVVVHLTMAADFNEIEVINRGLGGAITTMTSSEDYGKVTNG